MPRKKKVGAVVVTFRKGTKQKQVDELITRCGLNLVDNTLPSIGMYVFETPAGEEEVIVAALKAEAIVATAFKNGPVCNV